MGFLSTLSFSEVQLWKKWSSREMMDKFSFTQKKSTFKFRKTQKPKKGKSNNRSESVYPAVKLVLTATDLPNLEFLGQSDPYYQIYGYSLNRDEDCQLLYTSEVIANNVEFVKWKEAVFAISKKTIFSKFRIVILDKEVMQADRVLAGPIDLTIKDLEKNRLIDLGAGTKLRINKFERI